MRIVKLSSLSEKERKKVLEEQEERYQQNQQERQKIQKQANDDFVKRFGNGDTNPSHTTTYKDILNSMNSKEAKSDFKKRNNLTLWDQVKNIANGGGFITRKTGTGILGGIVGIGQAGLTDTANQLRKGENDKSTNIPVSALDFISSVLNPSRAMNRAMIEGVKNNFSTITNKDKNVMQKAGELFTNSASAGVNMNQAKATWNTGLQLMGKINNNLDDEVLRVNGKISKPVEELNAKLQEEGKKYDGVTNWLGDAGQTVGNMVPSITASAVTHNPSIGLGVMGISAKGQATQEALNKGADLEQAVKIGDAKMLVEIATEKMAGGIKLLGKGSLDDLADEFIKKGSKSTFGKFLLKQGYNVGGEITEELISDLAGNIIDKGTTEPDKKIVDFKQGLDTAGKTAFTTLVLNGLGGYQQDYNWAKQQTLEQQNQNTDNKVINQEQKTSQNGFSQTEALRQEARNKLESIKQNYDENSYNQMQEFIETAPNEKALNQVISDLNKEAETKQVAPLKQKQEVQLPMKQQETQNKSFEDVAFEAMNNYESNEVESPLKNRDMDSIGKQTKVNAYQYDNPKVKPYFQEMAQQMGEDLAYISSSDNRSTQKGGGTKLSATTKAMDILHNEQGYSYNQIAQGLQNIIDDKGSENNAISKKIELVIDEQLRNGYTNALGKNIEPNQEYINTITQNNVQNETKLPTNEIKMPTQQTINQHQENSINENATINKQKQLDIIQKSNPMQDDYHTGIRNIEDIKTFEEAMQDDESFVYGDYTLEDAQRDLGRGKVTVYSSNPIEQGGFVSTSQNMAKDYAGNGKIYSKEVNINDVAWINGDEGQYAKVENSSQNNISKLEERLSGEELLNTQDFIDEIKSVGAIVDENGYVTLYHTTTTKNAENIRNTGKMSAKEDGIFFSTKKNSQQSEGRGDSTLEFKIPAEILQLDDIFDDNADVRIPLNSKNSTIDVSQYLVNDSNLIENKNNVNYEDNYQKAFKDILNKSESEIRIQLDGIIDNIYRSKMPEGNQVVLNVVPENLQKLGVHNRPMLMAPRELRNAILSKDEAIKLGYPIGKNDSYHQLGKDKFYQVLNNLSDPVMVIKENDNKIIVFTEQFDYKGKQIIVPIEINTNSEYNKLEVQDVNVFKSMHGRSSISNYINKLLNKSSKVLYKNTKKIQSLFDNRKVQYPEAINSVSNNSISQNEQNVKSDSTNINNMQNNQENIQETKLPMKEKQEVKAPMKQENLQNTKGETINWNEIERPEDNKKFRKHYRSIIESSNTTAEAKAIAKELMGTDTYEPETNKGQLAQADQRIMTSSPEVELQSLLSRAMNGEKISSVDIAVGERLIQYFSKTGNKQQLQDAIQATAMAGTSAGQTVQALSMLNHQTPQGQATWIQRSVDKMNKELAKKKGGTITTDADGNLQVINKQGKDITDRVDLFNLTPEMIDKIMNSENQEQMYKNIDEVYEELGQQVPLGTLEKIDSWRYFSMLANARTHIRNMVGNVAMGKMQRAKDKIAGGIEDVVSKFNPEMERTKTLRRADAKTKDFAKQDFKNMEVQSRLELNENKYNPQSRLQNARRTFKSDAMENTLGRLFNLNDKLLSAEDGIGLKAGYQKALADYLTANKIDVDNITDAQLNKARNYAVQQAKEATFHQANAIASAVAQFENKNLATKLFTGAVLPFKKTPMNVAKAGMEYSPLQIAKSATVDLVNLRKGNISVNQYIDNLSKGMTGTGIALVGYALANAGILKASGGDDKDKEKYEEEQGKQSYSIQIAGKTYSLDWLAPTGIPLFIGAETHKLFNQEETEKSTEKRSEEDRLNQAIKGASNLLNAGATAINPMSEMSMISGLTSALSSYNTSDNLGSLGNMMTNMGKSYVNQFFPTLMGQVAKTGDEYERTTKSTAKGTIGKAVDQTINQIKNKVPGLRQTLPIKTDIWGKEVKQEVNLPLRAVNNFINPATVKEVSTDKVDMELNKLYEENRNSALLPDILTKTVQLNKQTYRLSNKEYAEFTKNYGQTSHKLIENFIKTSDYNKLTQEQKETAISNIYSYAKEQNKLDYAKKVNEEVKPSTLYTTMKEIEKGGGKQSEYLSYLAKTKGISKENEKNKVLADSNYSNKTKEIIYTNGTGKDDNLYNNLLSKSNIDMTEYLEYKNKLSEKAFGADKDKNGKTIAGSAKAKTINYLNNNITGVGNRLLIAGKSYALQNSEKQKLAEYINQIANTKEDRINIYKQLDKNFYVRNEKVYMRVSK